MESNNLPHSTEAEQSVIGAIIANPSVIPEVMELVKPDYFYSPQHKAIYSVIVKMYTGGSPADIVTILNEVQKLNIFENAAEGRRYLAEIANILPTTANVASYCRIVAEKYLLRCLATVAGNIMENIRTGENDAQILLDSAEQQIYDIRQGRDIKGLMPIAEAVTEAYDRLGKISGPDKEKYVGARTGFTLLDSIISGLNKSDLVIIAARPAMGKTAFAMNIAVNVAKRTEKDVVTFNLEMSSEQLALRMLSTESLIDSSRLRNGRITSEEWSNLATGAGYLGTLPIYIDDTASISVQQIKAKLRRVRNLGLVIIDYLQLISSSSSRHENRAIEVSEITRQLKIMAKELNVPVILLSQLSRGVESRTDKRPMLSDLRESGSIEQDADIVLFLYRDAYYNKESTKQNISECIVAKNRHGETGTIELIWDGRYTRFSNPDYSNPAER
ncbi:MAG: replicative DNA helicase [Muribaculaceae bacterium]|nr:replicative DNA helicase [Alistipes senegalensis]MCM1473880.1 replicative DNA helicase [Muribaculaceae bacterium]MDE6424671.1 replicative DNA helicase [Ruminococcus sp.]